MWPHDSKSSSLLGCNAKRKQTNNQRETNTIEYRCRWSRPIGSRYFGYLVTSITF